MSRKPKVPPAPWWRITFSDGSSFGLQAARVATLGIVNVLEDHDGTRLVILPAEAAWIRRVTADEHAMLEAEAITKAASVRVPLAGSQCTAMTEAKRRCRLPAVPGTDTCTIHAPKPAVA